MLTTLLNEIRSQINLVGVPTWNNLEKPCNVGNDRSSRKNIIFQCDKKYIEQDQILLFTPSNVAYRDGECAKSSQVSLLAKIFGQSGEHLHHYQHLTDDYLSLAAEAICLV